MHRDFKMWYGIANDTAITLIISRTTLKKITEKHTPKIVSETKNADCSKSSFISAIFMLATGKQLEDNFWN